MKDTGGEDAAGWNEKTRQQRHFIFWVHTERTGKATTVTNTNGEDTTGWNGKIRQHRRIPAVKMRSF